MSAPAIIIPSHHDIIRWRARATLGKHFGKCINDFISKYGWDEGHLAFARDCPPDEVIEAPGNLLMTAGATALWQGLAGSLATAFNSTNAYIGVGDSTTAESAAHTDLQAATNKLRKLVSGSPTISTNTTQYSAVFATGDANYTWNEWALFNASSGGTMLNRKQVNLGTKTSAASWTFTITLSLS